MPRLDCEAVRSFPLVVPLAALFAACAGGPPTTDRGAIRADFAESIDANAVHGSDAPETAAVEIAFFFPGMNTYSGR